MKKYLILLLSLFFVTSCIKKDGVVVEKKSTSTKTIGINGFSIPVSGNLF